MSNWERMMASKARHGSFRGDSFRGGSFRGRSFRGSGLSDEDAYYAFFADPVPRSVDCGGIVSAIVAIVTAVPRVLKGTFLAPATKLNREQA